jgi:hypothetical protein
MTLKRISSSHTYRIPRECCGKSFINAKTFNSHRKIKHKDDYLERQKKRGERKEEREREMASTSQIKNFIRDLNRVSNKVKKGGKRDRDDWSSEFDEVSVKTIEDAKTEEMNNFNRFSNPNPNHNL